MKIWKNTSTLNSYDKGLDFTEDKKDADVALIGSKSIELFDFPNLKGIFRAGIGKDNVPETEALKKNILVRYPSKKTINIIYNETASYTCNLIFRMMYNKIGKIDPWIKNDRKALFDKSLLVIGSGNIGSRVALLMKPFMKILTFDILNNNNIELPALLKKADCVTIHIPKNNSNESFMNLEKLKMMKDNSCLINTARGHIVDEEALYFEIKSGRLTAAFDVFWNEPYNGKLKKYHPEKFFMSPHIASTCTEFLEGCRAGLDRLIKDIEND
jgi:phosphoglycerate dehydrogenase-like enzyme